MIQINKEAAPSSLIQKGRLLHDAMKADYLLHKQAYKNGSKTFVFTNEYKSDEVKNKLMKVQHNKCCFCEAKFVNDYFHVEHFRPKGKVDSWPSGPSSYPGYYWLAYEWSNLFLAKGKTNSSYKRNFFPLYHPPTRNLSHLDKKIERPILINPGIENPRIHIRFKDEEIYGETDRGRENIKLLDLRNPQIDEARRTKCGLLKTLKTSIDMLINEGSDVRNPEIQKMIEHLRNSIKADAEFSSMAIDLLSGWPHL